MSFYNLSEYVKYGLFLQDIKANNPYDIILFERKFDSDLDFSKFNIKFLNQDNDSFVRQINDCVDKYDNVLLILEESNSYDVLWSIKFKANMTIINLYVGISWFGNKNKLDSNDIGYLLNLWFDVYEPWDSNNFLKILSSDGPKYIRLNNNDLPQNLLYFEEFAIIDQNLLDLKDILPLVNNGYNWFDGTVLVTWSLLANTIQALRISMDHYGNSFDLFCISKLNFELSNELIDSLKKNDLVILVIDQSYPNWFQDFIKSKFKEWGYQSTRIKFIYPEYEKLNTILEEYKLEQVWLDWLAIANNIHNIVKS
jgi:hypothetical protein